MRTITLSNGQIMGTNDRDGGVFAWARANGTWIRWLGNKQTPAFRDAEHFWRWLMRHYRFQVGITKKREPRWEEPSRTP